MQGYRYIVIHGIGDQHPGYSESLRTFLEIPKQSWGEVCWQPCFKDLEELGYKRVSKIPLMYESLRKFAFKYYGDVVSYDMSNIVGYLCVHAKLDEEVRKAQKSGKKIVIISHSLGTVIACGWLWDRLKETDPMEYPLSRVYGSVGDYLRRNLHTLVTLGSPIALFSLKYPNFGKPPKLKDKTKWINIVGVNDLISYPLADLNPFYKYRKIEDIFIKVGTKWWRRLLPIGHVDYFDDPEVKRMLISITRKTYLYE